MNALVVGFAAAFGAVVGSFLNVCIFRLPRRCLRVWRPKGSFCPQCRREIRWYENLPIVGYLLLGGRCRGCKGPIPLRYFMVEVANALLWAYVAHRWVIEPGRSLDPDVVPAWGAALTFALFGSALIVCALVDWDHRIIPDEVDVPGFLIAPLVAFAAPEVFGWGAKNAPDLVGDAQWLHANLSCSLSWWGLGSGATRALLAPLEHVAAWDGPWVPNARAAFASLLGVAFGGGLIWLIGWLGARLLAPGGDEDDEDQPADAASASSEEGDEGEPFEAMGFGDVKFMAMLGGFTGWQGVLATIVVAACTGAVFGIFKKIYSGRPTITGKDIKFAFETSPLGYRALRLWGAPEEAPDDQPVPLKLGGSLAARLATGEPHIAFGPFLALGAAVFAYCPEVLIAVHPAFGIFVPGSR